MTQTALDIQHLELTLGDQRLFQDFNLRLEHGQKITLVGPSGCGKSTLLRCILGFVMPDAGDIRVFGEPLTPASAWKLRARMAYVPQEPGLESGTVRAGIENIFSYRSNRHLQENLNSVPELLKRLILPTSILDKQSAELSGGEKQRIALLLAILLERDILLLDEVTSALDARSKEAVMQVLAELDCVSILGIAHDREWLKFADTVVDMAAEEGAMA